MGSPYARPLRTSAGVGHAGVTGRQVFAGIALRHTEAVESEATSLGALGVVGAEKTGIGPASAGRNEDGVHVFVSLFLLLPEKGP